ncbi:phosphomannomutase/phosphoglucomutase [Alloalcanivorax xenomutans]|uniref:phosphomannomutase/phosphoglucomutase n=1 Tax=Alloalcanivorax xenomutans TaxID=1094342 RepID=UPI0009B67725|nr:phosphomannomutase/phosphoglucomutase [Alloalcanivorax xenomutans]ARB45406.1 phosphoglucomutase [Alloalcanivorax xenomutans]
MSNIPLKASIFRAYDIRGIVGETLSEDIARQVGRAIAAEANALGEKGVAVARDGRLSGPSISAALIEGLRQGGCDVVDVGMVPTPVLYFATHVLDGVRSGVMVTGSHNPPDYNGFKIVVGGQTLSGERIQELYQRIVQADFSDGSGELTSIDLRDQYLQRIASDVSLKRPLKVVVDAGNGVAGELGPRLMERLGCDVIPLFTEIDGTFPNHHPDPGELENVQDLIRTVAETGADLGLGFDGDGDRVGVVTPKGELIYPDRLMMAFAEDVLSRVPGGRIIYDVKCTGNLAKVVSELGGDPEMWRTGHSLIKARMKETGAPLAGEMSGHIFFSERWYGFDDGLYAAARLAEILAAQEQNADAFFARYPQSPSTPEISIPVSEEQKFAVVEKLITEGDFGDGKRTTIDGIRVDYEDGWGLCRVSNTSPKLVTRYEGVNVESRDRIRAVFQKRIESAIQSVRTELES